MKIYPFGPSPSARRRRRNPSDLEGDELIAAIRAGKMAGADLQYADLTGANLSGVNLTGTDLTGANLYKANLTRAILRGVNLAEADLTDANLSGADLTGANLTDTDLTDTILEGVVHSNVRGTALPVAKPTKLAPMPAPAKQPASLEGLESAIKSDRLRIRWYPYSGVFPSVSPDLHIGRGGDDGDGNDLAVAATAARLYAGDRALPLFLLELMIRSDDFSDSQCTSEDRLILLDLGENILASARYSQITGWRKFDEVRLLPQQEYAAAMQAIYRAFLRQVVEGKHRQDAGRRRVASVSVDEFMSIARGEHR